MYSSSQLILKYLQYYISASNGKGHGTHSPFVFDFIIKVLNDTSVYPAYQRAEQLRECLLHDQSLLNILDFGAGSSSGSSGQRTIASIAKNAAKPSKYGQLLYRMVKKYEPKLVAELGTSLGITTSYLALAGATFGKVVSFEGAPEVASVAQRNFKDLGLQNIQLIEGNFDDTFRAWLPQQVAVDFCFIDGNHRKEPTLRYFEWLLPKLNANSILVFDDVHWSGEMEEAWELIKSHESVRCTIDLFFIGIVFFRDEFRERQHFKIRY
jgi:predicted O-methyltransferase YrrM